MNLPPESTNYNSDNRNFGDNSNSFVSTPLENLVNLLSESILEEDLAEATKLNGIVKSSSEINSKSQDRDKTLEKKAPTKKIATNNTSESLIVETEANSISIVEIFPKSEKSIANKNNVELPETQTTLEPADTEDSENSAKNAPIQMSPQWILEKERQIDELANYVNTLIPLMVQLSTAENKNSQECIQKAIVPIIDRVIQQRSEEDREKMAMAIANILPDAIRQEIINAPESIGKAIAPEIALSIKEQIDLDEGAIAEAMGSEMGKAIANQIEMERDAMVDALYPVIGSTISKYMTEVVQSINERVDNALSPVGIQRKIRAKFQGVTEAELILKESLPYSTRAIFLIHKDSGLVIQELQPDTTSPLESDLLAGMLTAIRSFANDCIAANSELDAIDYDNFQILFETAGYCYIAVVVNGEPNRQFRDRMREIFGQIVQKYGVEIKHYQGNPATIPQSIQLLLAELTYQNTEQNSRRSSKALYWVFALLLGSIFIPWGILKHRSVITHRIEKIISVELDATPELSVYRLTPQVEKGKLSLTGRVPSIYLKNLATQVSQGIATENNLELNNQIVAVNVPVDPTVTEGEIARLTGVINREFPGKITTQYQDRTVTIDSLFLDKTEQQNLIVTFSNIPGVEKVIFIATQQLPNLDTKIYFPSGTSQILLENDSAKIDEIERFLQKYPSIKLKIIGYSDREGIKATNLKLAKARANSVYQAIIDRGIDSSRLEIVASSEPPSDLQIDKSQPLWLSRCVRFESFLTRGN